MTLSDIGRLRLWAQQITHPVAETPGEVVSQLGAMQAQDYAGAKWAVGLRLPGATDADIERAVAERAIVRTWPMRGTLHFVAAADVRWMLYLLTPRVIAGSAARYKQLGLDDATFARSREVFTAALRGGRQLPRDDVYQALEDGGVPMNGQRGYHLLWRSAQEGLICFGSHAGKQPTFALLDEWVPADGQSAYPERAAALAELTRRYFTSHGPATVPDLCRWAGLTVGDARIGLEEAKPYLRHEAIDDQTYWMARDLPDAPFPNAPDVHLLPGFDEYLLGYRDRTAVLAPEDAPKIVPGSNGVFLPTVVIDGQVAGLWKRTVSRKGVKVTAQPFRPFTKAETDAFTEAAERYGGYLGLTVSVGDKMGATGEPHA